MQNLKACQPLVGSYNLENFPADQLAARRCLESALRVLINLSHNSQPWCQSLLDEEHTIPMVIRFIVTAHQQRYGQAEVTQGGLKPEEKDAQAFDRLCLALGLLTNLVQVEEKAKDLSRETSAFFISSFLFPHSQSGYSSLYDVSEQMVLRTSMHLPSARRRTAVSDHDIPATPQHHN